VKQHEVTDVIMCSDVKSSISIRTKFYGTEFYTCKFFVDCVYLNWFVSFCEVVFRWNNGHTLL
jgi:hypothetical protein